MPTPHLRRPVTLLAVAALIGSTVAAAAPASAAPADPPPSTTFVSQTNPILGDGSYYSADPAPLVVPAGAPGNTTGSDQLVIYTGHDEAGPTTNDFIMNEWGSFTTTDVDAGEWTHHPSLMRPEDVFAWATPGRAYAGQVVIGTDDRYYWYVPVHERDSTASDKFGIGVAVADSPTGPWTDHVGGPIISQTLPTPNTIHNIDPTILLEGEGEDTRVHIYWGSFSNLRVLELDQDMKTPVGEVATVSGLTGFFEAAWAFERNGTYYLAYAGNNAGPTSQCTPANYHACIAYGTAPSPTGPWTYRGTILAPVSSTTSHPGIVELDGEWWMAYHTADAEGGNHFRRSVAIDRVVWDDTQTPARMLRVETTPAATKDLTPRANVAQEATVTVSNEPVPVQYWVKALNDELVRPNPLPPDMWGTWTGDNPPQQWIQYTWDRPVRISGSEIDFWSDAPRGSGVGVAAPDSWTIQYFADGTWQDVPGPSGYGIETNGYQGTTFDAVTTTQVRAVLNASTNGSTYSGVAVEEWKVLAEQATTVTAPDLVVEVGEQELPGSVLVTYPGGVELPGTAFWDAVTAEQVAAPGTFEVSGSVLGWAGGRVTATVTVIDPGDTAGDTTDPEVALTPLGSAGSAGWFRSDVRVRVDGTDDRGGRLTLSTAVDGGAPVVVTDARTTEVGVTGDGEHAVTATATDRAGNVSPVASLEVAIDRTNPVSTATLDTAARSVTVTAADATSGLDRIEVRLGTGAWSTATGPVAAPDSGQHVVGFRAVDRAGNVEQARTLTIPADISGPLTGNIGPLATATASYTAGWNSLPAVQDDVVPASPSQGQLWGTWSGTRPASQWVAYQWPRPIRITSAETQFWNDAPAGSGDGVAAPSAWVLQTWDEATSAWVDVPGASAYGTSTTALNPVTFTPITTDRVRALVSASTNGSTFAAVAASELRVFADDPGTGPVDPGEDTVAPVVTLAAAPAPASGWAAGDVVVTASATDDSGVTPTIEVAVGDGAFTAVTGPVTLTDEGSRDVRARARDAAGNVSQVATVRVGIDRTVPTVAAVVDTASRTVTATGADSLSGVASVEHRVQVDGGALPSTWTPVTAPVTVGADAATVHVRATDRAGNVSAAQSVRVPAATPEPETPVFGDVPAGSQFETEISWLASAGISTGWELPDGSREFRPVTPIARDAMAAFLYRLAGSPDFRAPEVSPFTDVDVSNQFYEEITWLAEKKISTGWVQPDGTAQFRPYEPIARDAMAAFLHRAAGSPAVALPATSPFDDITPSTQFYAEITWMHSEEISTGWEGNDGSRIYQPLSPVNRDAMAAFLHRFHHNLD
ncbi:OmpL47-type beta-barrel domain-containing protein [Serinibacter arcticus]|uniref:Glycerol-3-phosphate ABC transporter, periplasmic glycerol-3-phosphate-binding protein n=1 Tax=Serinibacter arcticus TaxID=1655435 RepID=A0A4Z1E5P0_9MICO|nr:family 43 glycosylhydrolase [Serinibacter arcticus]TGO05753.1 Glycerol-3-phosphate ABC transporter, periplasmic glycerol-3-phosphate-binding protein [Serinibacter arcticus]